MTTKPQYRVLTAQGELIAHLNLIQGMTAKAVNTTLLANDPQALMARDNIFAMLRILRERTSAVMGDDSGDTQPMTLGAWVVEQEDKSS